MNNQSHGSSLLHFPDTREPQRAHLLSLLSQLQHVDQLLQDRLRDTLDNLEDQIYAENFSFPPDALVNQIQQRLGFEEWVREFPELLAGARQRLPSPDSRLGKLVTQFALDDFERDLLLLCLLPIVDSRYSKLFACIQQDVGKTALTLGFAQTVLCRDMAERAVRQAQLSPSAPLFRHRVLRLRNQGKNAAAGHDSAVLEMDLAIYHFLLGHDYLSPVLDAYVQWRTASDLSHHDQRELSEQLQSCFQTVPDRRAPVVVLRGRAGSGQTDAVARAAAEVCMPTLAIDLAVLPEDERDAEEVLVLTLREARMHGACLVLRALDEMADSRKTLFAALRARLRDHPLPVVCLSGPHAAAVWLGEMPHVVLDMPSHPTATSEALIRTYLNAKGIKIGRSLDVAALARRYAVPVETLEQTLSEADFYRANRADDASLSEADLRRALRLRAQQNFGKLAQRIEPARDFSDLIVGPELALQLKEILAAIRHRDRALRQGFDRKVGEARGISALFFGDSGTGKTMAAEVLAGALGVDLIKIDLSTVVNKYIGETEKNLSKVFDLAEEDCGVLFFDEADALFGKRTETKDAQDRHANIEVSYLLQRLERYPGLVILSTNNRAHLDEAFNRRLTFITRFPFPDATLRERMWRAIWPPQIALDKTIDLGTLAQRVEITGANIRNAALLATWLAAEDGSTTIQPSHLEQAVKRELSKIGRIRV